jgi:hypothetical protein
MLNVLLNFDPDRLPRINLQAPYRYSCMHAQMIAKAAIPT